MSHSIDTMRREFRIARQNRKLSLREVETKTGISNAFLSQFESGKAKNIGLINFLKLCEIYGIKITVAFQSVTEMDLK